MIQTLQWTNSKHLYLPRAPCQKINCSQSIPHQFTALMKIASAKLIYVLKKKKKAAEGEPGYQRMGDELKRRGLCG